MRRVKPFDFYKLWKLNWPFGRGFHAWRSFLVGLVLLIVILVCISPIVFIATLCRFTEVDWNPMSRYRKRKRKERLEQVGKEWEAGRKARKERRLLPNVLEGRERENELVCDGKVDEQDKSSLYKLPREIRDMIWKEATGGYLVHIYWVEAYRKFSISRCKCENRNCIGLACHGVRRGRGMKDLWGNVDLLNYLLICRKMYEEILPMIYGENHFQFRYVINILRFSLTIPFQQMLMIQKAQWKRLKRRPLDVITDENDFKYRTFPQCKGVDYDCYCLRCWKKEDWQRHYGRQCNVSDQPIDVVCSGCWSENPASQFWH